MCGHAFGLQKSRHSSRHSKLIAISPFPMQVGQKQCRCFILRRRWVCILLRQARSSTGSKSKLASNKDRMDAGGKKCTKQAVDIAGVASGALGGVGGGVAASNTATWHLCR